MIQTGTNQGMQTMDQCLQKMIDDDKITVAAAREKAINKNLFPLPEIDGE
jgi:twitching motility protein PilT